MAASLSTNSPTSPLPIQDGWSRATFNISIVMPIFAILAVIGRFYTRRLVRLRLGIDDWFILVALLLFLVYCIETAIAVPYGGIGHHRDDLDADRLMYLRKLIFAGWFLYCSPLAFAKASVCLFLLRMFGRKRWFRLAAYATLALTACFMVFNILSAFFMCRPLAAMWDSTIIDAQCGDAAGASATFIAVAVFDVGIDIIIIVLPIPIIWSLKMPTKYKLSVMAILVFGAFDTVAGIVRITASTKLDFETDWTVAMGEFWFWSVLEPGMAVCVVCLVVMRPLLDKLTSHHRSTEKRTSLQSTGTESCYVGDGRAKLAVGRTTVQDVNELYDINLDDIIREDDLRLLKSCKQAQFDTPTERGIIVSREVYITVEDRNQNTPNSV